MRDYGKVSPNFWTRGTGKSLRGCAEAQIVALYLMTTPHASMIGVFHLPMLYIAHETGLTLEGATKGLQRCIDVGFCVYDHETESVFVIQFAANQIGETLKPGDLRAKGIYKQYLAVAGTECGRAFFERYGEDYSLPSRPLESPLEAPCKPLASPIEDSSKGLLSPNNTVTAIATVPVVRIPLEDGTEFDVTPELLTEYRAAYPRVDVEAELRKARAWSVSNPAKRKTRRGCPKFLNTWLANAAGEAAKRGVDTSGIPGGGRRELGR